MARPLKNSRSPSKSCGTSRPRKGWGDRARDLSRTHRERLLRNGFLQEVIKGWYIPSRPDEVKRESTAWYASFWRFCAAYLESAFRRALVLSPGTITFASCRATGPCPASSRRGRRARATRSPNSRMARPCWSFASRCRVWRSGRKRPACGCSRGICPDCVLPNYFSNNATDVRAVLPMIRDASGLLARLLEGGHTVIAGRLAGAFRNVGRDRIGTIS